MLAPLLGIPQLAPIHQFYDLDGDEIAVVARIAAQHQMQEAGKLISERTLDTYVAAGSVDDVIPGVEHLLDAGASTITFSGRLGPDPELALHLLGSRAPDVRGQGLARTSS